VISDRDKQQQWETNWRDHPPFRHVLRVATAVWGAALLADAALRVVMAATLPVDAVPLLDDVLLIVTLAALLVFQRLFGRAYLRGHGLRLRGVELVRLPVEATAASKHALVGLVRSTATRLAHDGVKVNALCPGLVDTPLLAPYREPLTEAGHTFADPDEAADAVEAILTDGRTGQAWIVLNGRPPTQRDSLT